VKVKSYSTEEKKKRKVKKSKKSERLKEAEK